jgi:hypothetical protein
VLRRRGLVHHSLEGKVKWVGKQRHTAEQIITKLRQIEQWYGSGE